MVGRAGLPLVTVLWRLRMPLNLAFMGSIPCTRVGGKKLLWELVKYLPRTQRRERDYQALRTTATEMNEIVIASQIVTFGGVKHQPRATGPKHHSKYCFHSCWRPGTVVLEVCWEGPSLCYPGHCRGHSPAVEHSSPVMSAGERSLTAPEVFSRWLS